ncbi:hypothetical protein [Methylobacter sp.]|uniref:hypothetical protein n=1 Tax=Methylobacter sp. TaxID=2051955 RepID=UPI002489A8EA|nr:hypothetical protein [Methylobacter sp.]MDI1279261.1 hypothetical protein [Methylobacter sp.]
MMNNNCSVPCPYCGKPVDVIQGMEMLAGNEWTTLLQALPISIIGALLRYLELFKPLKQELRWSRRLVLTQELMPMIKAAQVKRNGITYAAPLPVWEAEMLKLAARPASVSLPLKSNGYLLAVLVSRGEQNAAKLELDIEQRRQSRGATGSDQGLPPPVDTQQVTEMLQQETERKRQAREAQEQKKPPDGWRGSL